MICGICNEKIEEGLRYVSCTSCSDDYHVGHVVEWTENDWQCLSCGDSLQEEIKQIEVIVELHSSFITVGFAGETKPRHRMPFQIGKPKYRSVCSVAMDPVDYYNFFYAGYFDDALKALPGLIKSIDISKKGMIINPPYFLQVLNYCFYHILKIDPMNHAMVIANSVLTNEEQRSLIQALLFDVFGIPRIFMSSHQFFAVLGTDQSSGLTIELDHDMVIIVPVVDKKVHHAGVRMEFLSEDEMIDHQVDLRSEIKDMRIIKKINHFVKDCLQGMDSQVRSQMGKKVLCFDLEGRINNTEKFSYRLQILLDEYGLSDSKIEVVCDIGKYVSWAGINHFVTHNLIGYSWTPNPEYRSLGRQYLRDFDLSPQIEQ